MGFWTKHVHNSLPGKVVRTTSKASMGGAALLLALFLMLFFRFGDGTGDGDGEADPASKDAAGTSTLDQVERPEFTSTADQSKMTSLVPDSEQGGLSVEEKRALSSDVLTLLIDERNYMIEIPGSEVVYRPVSLERAIELAQLAKGDTNGIRVKILRRETARASSEEKLKLDLNKVGIQGDAVYMAEHLVP